jgi:hypothetical protein
MKKIVNLAFLGWCGIAHAVCPLCTFAVGAGVGLAEWFGIDDAISGLWIGGLIMSLILWTFMWLDKKSIRFFGDKIIVVLVYYLIVVAPLFFTNVIGHPANVLWGIDKLLLGIILGSIFFLAGVLTHLYLRKHNNDLGYFPFQKVVLPVVNLIILSGVFYFL